MKFSAVLVLLLPLASATASYGQSVDDSLTVCFTFSEADLIGDSLDMRTMWQRAYAQEHARHVNARKEADSNARSLDLMEEKWRGCDTSKRSLIDENARLTVDNGELKLQVGRARRGMLVTLGAGTLLGLFLGAAAFR